jgi:hypothetical protein
LERATLTPPAAGTPSPARRAGSPGGFPWPWLALGALVIATVIAFLVYPTFPNYDSYYSLLWGREVLDGVNPSFDAYRAPTEHPLAIVFGAVLSLLGDPADRVMVAATLVSFVALAVGLYRLASAAFTPLVGLVAAGLLCTRFDFPFLAARAYIDIPYLAFVIWAAALEAERPRRGTPVAILLALAGLMRPEAWLLSGLYFLWIALPLSWPQRVKQAIIAGAAPVIWSATDLIVTGDWKFSLTHTSGLAEELGRTRGFSEVPSATIAFLKNLDKPPVFLAGILGVLLAVVIAPRRLWMPLALLVVGIGTFFMVGLAGLSVIDRYLLVPSLMVMVFAAVALAGWTMLREGTMLRRVWAVGALALVIYGAVFTALRVNLRVFDNELRFRGEAHASLERILRARPVQEGLRCGPLSVPTHKLVPEARWLLDARERDVVARSDDRQQRRIQRGVALYTTNRSSLLRQALVERSDDPLDSVPLPGFQRVATERYYGAYVRC